MASEKNSQKYIVTINQDKIEPDLAKETVIKYDPLNRAGKEGGFYINEEGELHIKNEDVMEAHKMAINKYPYENAIKLIQLPFEEGEKIHQFGENQFRLYNLPSPEKGNVKGLIGKNGIGKSVSLKILKGNIKPNLGNWENPPNWKKIKEKFRGTELQKHVKKLSQNEIKGAYKPQQIENLPEIYEGKIKDLLEKTAEKKEIEEIARKLDINHLLDRKINKLSGGELQRVAIATTILKEADIYMFDEPSSFLDIKQRLQSARQIRKLRKDKKVLTVEHDLATLDLISDNIHIYYGEAASYGMASKSYTSKEGINRYLEGYLPSENIKFRDQSIKFDRTKRSQVERNKPVFKFPELEKNFGKDKFELQTKKGKIHKEEIFGIFGENGLGKTVFAKLLAGKIKPDKGKSPDITISYKPQYLEAKDETVEEAISKHAKTGSKRFKNRIAKPLEITKLYEQNLEELSGGELQKVGIAISLAKDADAYLLDEPSAYLDIEARVKLGKTLKRYARKTENPLMVIDHDLMFLDYISDRGMVFKGEPGKKGRTTKPLKIDNALNTFLKELDITFRKDPDSGRPRANKPESQKDKKQRKNGEYYEQ